METVPSQCPVAWTTRVMGGKWKARIVWALMRSEPLSFSDLRRACPPISDRILSRELKELVSWEFVDRTEFPTKPPRTEYRLSPSGQSLRPLMAAMADWGLSHAASLNLRRRATSPVGP